MKGDKMKNKTHTHKGHCQVCGRIQAVDVNYNRIAKHGYTVDFGFFNGVCDGSNKLPLEVDKSITERTILSLTDYVESQSAHLQGLESGEVKNLATYWVTFKNVKQGEEDKVVDLTNHKKSLHRYYDENKYCSSFSYSDESFAKHNESRNENAAYYDTNTAEEMMEKLIIAEIRQTKSNINQATYLKQQLVEMVTEVHGQPLINVADSQKVLKELEQEAKEGFYESKPSTKVIYDHVTQGKKTINVLVYTQLDKIAERETSIGTVGIKVSRPTVRKLKKEYAFQEKVSCHCLLNGKKIARAKLIEKLQ